MRVQHPLNNNYSKCNYSLSSERTCRAPTKTGCPTQHPAIGKPGLIAGGCAKSARSLAGQSIGNFTPGSQGGGEIRLQ